MDAALEQMDAAQDQMGAAREQMGAALEQMDAALEQTDTALERTPPSPAQMDAAPELVAPASEETPRAAEQTDANAEAIAPRAAPMRGLSHGSAALADQRDAPGRREAQWRARMPHPTFDANPGRGDTDTGAGEPRTFGERSRNVPGTPEERRRNGAALESGALSFSSTGWRRVVRGLRGDMSPVLKEVLSFLLCVSGARRSPRRPNPRP